MTAAQRQAVGAYGERVAVRTLTEAGMGIVERNWRSRHGEVDIIARDGDCLVFCEVKTRRGGAYGQAVEAVTAAKAGRLRRLAGEWLAQHPDHGWVDAVRIDVVAVTRPPSGPAQVQHLRGIL